MFEIAFKVNPDSEFYKNYLRLWFALWILWILVVCLAVLVRVSTALSPQLVFSIRNFLICARE